MPPARKSTPPRTTTVRAHTRWDGTKVKSHNRQLAWQQARAAAVGAGISGVTSLALVVEFGFTLLSTIAIVLTALLGLLAVVASEKATANKRKMRAKAKARRASGKGRGRKRS